MSTLKSAEKAFDIFEQEVRDSHKQVKANKGAPGVDGVGLEEFEEDLENNLYKIWNRLSSGSYFPPPVRAVEIPKSHGSGVRILGIPTVADRVAQTVVARRIEAVVEPLFHPDSYGYRPNRSALDAVGACRRRCWARNWVIDLDVRAFFDSVPWDKVLATLRFHNAERWVVLYVTRWLAAPLVLPDGTVQQRERGTPQGSPISPVLANLFLHHAFDQWITREYPGVDFERYADDVVVHCATKRQAQDLLVAIKDRLATVGLEVHPIKTRIVYCKDGKRRGFHENIDFTFLGFTFRARGARDKKGRGFTSFLPAVSKDALNKMSQEVRRWRLHRHIGQDLAGLAHWVNPVVRGWLAYYGAFYRSELAPLLTRINTYLVRWLRGKYRKLAPLKKAKACWLRIVAQQPGLFVHWKNTTAFW